MHREFWRVLAYSGAAFLKEAAVLVFVFSLLEKIIHTGGVPLLWVLASVISSVTLLLSGVWIEYRAGLAFGSERT